MTKLEELKAAAEAAGAVLDADIGAACDAAQAVADFDGCGSFAAAWDAADACATAVAAARDTRNAAWVAYQDELEKTQEENSDDD
jgi:hypothetical protein